MTKHWAKLKKALLLNHEPRNLFGWTIGELKLQVLDSLQVPENRYLGAIGIQHAQGVLFWDIKRKPD